MTSGLRTPAGSREGGYHLAFYKGPGRPDDRLIRFATRSIYSHVELLWLALDQVTAEGALAISSSGRDGGVRTKRITFAPDRWDVLAAPWAPDDAWDTAEAELDRRYDYIGILLSQIVRLQRHARTRWFCSELCAAALGFEMPQSYSPGDLARTVVQMNRAFVLGRNPRFQL
ncbi:MAG: hypothetical protein QNJ16_02025 [Rhodobacter sp.]|nr:hypothetical protein [Rhodobacter sp.]